MTSPKNDHQPKSPLPYEREAEQPRARTDHATDDWDGDPRFAPFPNLPVFGGATAWDDQEGPDEWDGDPRFADYLTPPVVHGLDGIDDTHVVAVRHDLRVVDDVTFNAVQAMRPSGRRGGTR